MFKSKRGLVQHKAFIRKYNLAREDFYKLPEKFIEEFKKTLVFLIHCQLPCHFTKIGMKVVTVACTQSQFFATFTGFIHHYSNKTRMYKCIFRGPNASATLAQIFDDVDWGIRFYPGKETTLVLTNLDDVEPEEENPLVQKRRQKTKNHCSKAIPKNQRYKRGEVIIEWKPKKEKDAGRNTYEAGFLQMHFWITKRRII